MAAMADEHPRGILPYSTHCVYIPSISNFSYFFPQVSRQEQKRVFSPPNRSPHTEISNILRFLGSGLGFIKTDFSKCISIVSAAAGRPLQRTPRRSPSGLCARAPRGGTARWHAGCSSLRAGRCVPGPATRSACWADRLSIAGPFRRDRPRPSRSPQDEAIRHVPCFLLPEGCLRRVETSWLRPRPRPSALRLRG